MQPEKTVPGEKCGMLVSTNAVLRHAAESPKHGEVHRRRIVERVLSLSGSVLPVTLSAVFSTLSSTITYRIGYSFSFSSSRIGYSLYVFISAGSTGSQI